MHDSLTKVEITSIVLTCDGERAPRLERWTPHSNIHLWSYEYDACIVPSTIILVWVACCDPSILVLVCDKYNEDFRHQRLASFLLLLVYSTIFCFKGGGSKGGGGGGRRVSMAHSLGAVQSTLREPFLFVVLWYVRLIVLFDRTVGGPIQAGGVSWN